MEDRIAAGAVEAHCELRSVFESAAFIGHYYCRTCQQKGYAKLTLKNLGQSVHMIQVENWCLVQIKNLLYT